MTCDNFTSKRNVKHGVVNSYVESNYSPGVQLPYGGLRGFPLKGLDQGVLAYPDRVALSFDHVKLQQAGQVSLRYIGTISHLMIINYDYHPIKRATS